MWVKFLALFEKQALLAKIIAGNVILSCSILKSYFRDLVQKMIEALVVNKLGYS